MPVGLHHTLVSFSPASVHVAGQFSLEVWQSMICLPYWPSLPWQSCRDHPGSSRVQQLPQQRQERQQLQGQSPGSMLQMC
jgi:hypothetical protein